MANPIVKILAEQIWHEDKAKIYSDRAENERPSLDSITSASLAVYHQLAAEARRGEVERLDKES